MNIETLISTRLRELRCGKELSLEYVASKIGVHRETLRRYEKDPGLMPVEIFIKILNLYEYDLSIFFNEINGKMP